MAFENNQLLVHSKLIRNHRRKKRSDDEDHHEDHDDDHDDDGSDDDSELSIKALVDEVEFFCKGWEDPEEMGIKGYVLYARKLTAEKASPMLKVAQFDPSNPAKIRFPLGSFEMSAEITDIWGAKSFFVVHEGVEIIEPTIEERIEFEDSGIIDQTKETLIF